MLWGKTDLKWTLFYILSFREGLLHIVASAFDIPELFSECSWLITQ